MAIFLSNGVVVTLATVALSDHVTSATINRSFDELEVSAMGDSRYSGRAVCGRLCLSCHQPVSGRPCQSGIPARARLACGDGRRLAATVLDHGERHTGPDLFSRVQTLRVRSDPALLALGGEWPDRFGGLGELQSGEGEAGGQSDLRGCAGD